VQATFEDPSDPKRIIRAVLDMSTDDLASFLTDLRRAQKEISSDVEEVDAEPLAPTLPGLGEEDSGTPEQVAQAVGDVKVAAERAKTRGARA
jgi:hypothetical protein